MRRSSLVYSVLIIAGVIFLASSVKTAGVVTSVATPTPSYNAEQTGALSPIQFSPSPKVPLANPPSPTPSPSSVASPSPATTASPVVQSATVKQVVAASPSPTSTPTQLLNASTAQTTTQSNGTYTNVDGNQVQRPTYSDTVPAGATARCKDGSYSFSQHRSGTCSGHGGVAQWL